MRIRWWWWALEITGVACLAVAAGSVAVPLGIAVAGIYFVIVANLGGN